MSFSRLGWASALFASLGRAVGLAKALRVCPLAALPLPEPYLTKTLLRSLKSMTMAATLGFRTRSSPNSPAHRRSPWRAARAEKMENTAKGSAHDSLVLDSLKSLPGSLPGATTSKDHSTAAFAR